MKHLPYRRVPRRGGTINLPRKLWQDVGWQPGEVLCFAVDGDSIVIRRAGGRP